MSEVKDLKNIPLFSLLFLLLCFLCITLSVYGIFQSFGNSLKHKEYQYYELAEENRPPIRAYVSGAVNNPGVYNTQDSFLIIDLIEAANGFSTEVDLQFVNKDLNLAERVFNGDHVYIPFKNSESSVSESIIPLSSESRSLLVDLNNASIQELESLPGIGEKTAIAIIEGRPYKNIQDLTDINGIGNSTYSKLEDLIVVY